MPVIELHFHFQQNKEEPQYPSHVRGDYFLDLRFPGEGRWADSADSSSGFVALAFTDGRFAHAAARVGGRAGLTLPTAADP